MEPYLIYAPYNIGDVLWVKETWSTMGEWTCVDPDVGMFDEYLYKANWISAGHPHWRHPIHMPRKAARIFLRVTDVRVERLQDITASQAIHEGIPWEDVTPFILATPQVPWIDVDELTARKLEYEERELVEKEFGELWDSAIKPEDIAKYGWDANPWVWVIKFERCEKPENWEALK